MKVPLSAVRSIRRDRLNSVRTVCGEKIPFLWQAPFLRPVSTTSLCRIRLDLKNLLPNDKPHIDTQTQPNRTLWLGATTTRKIVYHLSIFWVKVNLTQKIWLIIHKQISWTPIFLCHFCNKVRRYALQNPAFSFFTVESKISSGMFNSWRRSARVRLFRLRGSGFNFLNFVNPTQF